MFINILLSGVIILYTILAWLGIPRTGLSLPYRVTWIVISLFTLWYTLELSGVLQLPLPVYLFILTAVPFSVASWILSTWKPGITYVSLLMIPISIGISFADSKIVLFGTIFDTVTWLILFTVAVILYKSTKKSRKSPLRNLVPAVFFTGIPFFIPGLVNIILTIIKQRPIQIVSFTPPLIGAGLTALLVLEIIHSRKEASRVTTIDPQFFQKMSLSEKLAASIIHEIKNPLAAIQSLTQQLHERIDTIPVDKSRNYLTIMEEELAKVKELSDSFLLAVRKDNAGGDTLVDLYLAMKSVEALMQFELRKHEITLRIEKSLLGVKSCISEQHLRQVMINILFNAIEAGATLIQVDGIRDDEWFNITITNNGPPIKAKDRSSIFNPLYTTRADGTGLGLAISRTILESYGGKLTLQESNSDRTIFVLSLVIGEKNEPSDC
jgi:signal transduction histidine kinase